MFNPDLICRARSPLIQPFLSGIAQSLSHLRCLWAAQPVTVYPKSSLCNSLS